MKVRGDVLVMMLLVYVVIGISMMNVISPVPLHWLGILRHMTVVSITVPYTANNYVFSTTSKNSTCHLRTIVHRNSSS